MKSLFLFITILGFSISNLYAGNKTDKNGIDVSIYVLKKSQILDDQKEKLANLMVILANVEASFDECTREQKAVHILYDACNSLHHIAGHSSTMISLYVEAGKNSSSKYRQAITRITKIHYDREISVCVEYIKSINRVIELPVSKFVVTEKASELLDIAKEVYDTLKQINSKII